MNIIYNQQILPFNTFHVQAISKAYTCIEDLADIKQLTSLKNEFGKFIILGGGSNILFTKDFDGIVIHNKIKGIEKIKETKQSVWLKVYSGTIWHDFVLYTVQNNWSGIENLSLIPGTVGASPIQNIGAYGVEAKESIVEVLTYEILTHKLQKFTNEACHFGYRDSIFKRQENQGKYFILSVTFKLNKNPTSLNISYGDVQKIIDEKYRGIINVKNISEAIIHIRSQKLPNPDELGNAGSFFKNPIITIDKANAILEQYPQIPHYQVSDNQIKIPAAWLIEQCGWKGQRDGNTGNHSRQALVIVNYGNASGLEISMHASKVQKSVLDKFGIQLQSEVNII